MRAPDVREWIRALRAQPLLLQFGLVVFTVASGLDLLYHTTEGLGWTSVTAALDVALGQDAYPVHVLMFAGMVLILLGVISLSGRSNDDVKRTAWPHQPAWKAKGSVKH